MSDNIVDAFDAEFITFARGVLAEGGEPALKFSRFVGLMVLREAEKAALLNCTAQEAVDLLFPGPS